MERRSGWYIYVLLITIFLITIVSADFAIKEQYQTSPPGLADLRRLNLLAGLSLILLSSMVFIIFQRSISLPLQKLVAAIRMIVEGEKESLEPIEHSNHIGPVLYGIEYLHKSLHIQIQDLESERESLRSVLDQITDGIVIADDKGRVFSMNPAAENYFHTKMDDALGHSVAEVLRHHQWIELYRSCVENKSRVSSTLEIPSQKVFFQGIASPFLNTLPGYTLMVFQDLSQLKRLETTRQDFISNISHELRTPLASLKALTDTLQEGALDDPAASRRFLGRMDTEVDTLTHLVSELLELSRIESGKVPLDLESTSPDHLLTQAQDRMKTQSMRKNLDIVINCEPGLPTVRVDPRRIGQVLTNLLHNAIKFSDPGNQIILSATKADSAIKFSVEDFGMGISERDQERIFERFYKTDQARSSGGTGLGLSIAKHLVEAHQGTIQVESTLNQGSTFSFFLPFDANSGE